MTWEEKQLLKEYKENISNELFTDLRKDMKACCIDYNRHKMLASIIDTMHDIDELLGSEDTMSYAVESKSKMPCELTEEKAIAWVDNMEVTNGDGTHRGEYWTIEQTTSVAEQYGIEFEHIRPLDFWVAMNEAYTDNSVTARKHGIADTDIGYYVDLAKDILFDIDAVPPKEKLYYYYKYIVKK